MRGRKRKRKKSYKKQIIVIVVMLFACEGLFNHCALYKELLKFVGNIANLVFSGIFGVGFFACVIKCKKKILNYFEKADISLKKVLYGEKGPLNITEHILYELIRQVIDFFRPLLSGKVKGYVILFVFCLTPFIAAVHPYRTSGKVIEKVSETAVKTVKDILVWETVENGDKLEDNQQDNERVESEMEGEKDKSNNAVQGVSDNKGTNDVAESLSARARFKISSNISDKTIDEVRQRILYKSEEYVEIGGDITELPETIKQQLAELETGEPEYMEKYFPITETNLSESSLYILEKEFQTEIENQSVPDSKLLNEVIGGRTGVVRKIQSYRMASALANNYLEYVLEYDNQKIYRRERIYYSGMAILAGQLQYHYAEDEEERSESANWIEARYREIKNMGLIEGDEERLEIIINTFSNL